ncbi:hypothetical protein GCM10022243_43580 [Saccharothrix violaceirubra]|uniref:RDD domain-containing protein n=1 Tax=Saccharothrix violaceirubra TaxID=413306 RepID=A0A7W7T2Z5_9PSEU|nr:RDD family protein [Saccharothrix violaceirubra]MBB4965647.1 hypothetical protein [Saccharothrix violaceirubra]
MRTQSAYPRNLGRRWIARLVDWALILVITSPLWVVAVGHVKHSAAFAAVSTTGSGVLEVVALRWDEAGDQATAGLSEVWDAIVLSVAGAAVAQVVLVALYDFAAHALFGRTVGKAVTSLVLTPVDGSRRVRATRALARASITVLLPGLGWVALIVAVLRLDVLIGLVGVALLVLSTVECLSLRGPSCWHDRRTGTTVRPVDWAAKLAAVRDSTAWAVAQQAPRRVADQGRSLRDRFGGGGPTDR